VSHAFVRAELGSEEVRQGQKVINEMITCLYKLNGDHTWGFFTTVPPSFHRSDKFFGFTRQYANKPMHCTPEVLAYVKISMV